MTSFELAAVVLSLIAAIAALLAWWSARAVGAQLLRSERDAARIETAVREEAANSRRESADLAARGRDELAAALGRFGDAQVQQADLLGRQLAGQLEAFARQLE
ncbi:MAG TPA: hypothetical protein VFK72_05350, partial [Nevskia sp.]|nr:hypothetical protein [Nevskia sp.]